MTKNSKIHTTNYFNTLIQVAEDTKTTHAVVPTSKNSTKTVAEMQYDMIARNPYQFTSDDVLFRVFAERNGVATEVYEEARQAFFNKAQACFRCSPLAKTYGFGIHSDHEGKIALIAMESEEYQKLLQDLSINKIKAMRSSKKVG